MSTFVFWRLLNAGVAVLAAIAAAVGVAVRHPSALLASLLLLSCAGGAGSSPSVQGPTGTPAGARAALPSLLARALRAPAEGRAICDAARETLATLRRDPSTFVRHSPAPPARHLGATIGFISSRGALLPLPRRPYEVSLTYRRDGLFEASLFTGPRRQPSVILLAVVDTEPMQDVFALADDPRPPSPERVGFTRRLFGKAPDLLDMLSLGLQVTPDTVRCDPTRYHPALRDLVLLVFKAVGGSARAHLDLGVVGSVLQLDERAGRSTTHYLFRHAGRVYTYDSAIADRTLADELEEGFLLLASRPRPAASAPPALAQLFAFVERPTPPVARVLLSEARQRPGTRGAAATIAALERYLAVVRAP